MVCLGRPFHLKFFKGCLPQILLGPFLNTMTQMCLSSTIPDELKFADIVPGYKKQDVKDKSNYRLISFLPIISKLFEKVLYEQLETVANEIFFQKLHGLRKAHS